MEQTTLVVLGKRLAQKLFRMALFAAAGALGEEAGAAGWKWLKRRVGKHKTGRPKRGTSRRTGKGGGP